MHLKLFVNEKEYSVLKKNNGLQSCNIVVTNSPAQNHNASFST